MIHALLNMGESVLGSFIAGLTLYVIFEHYHLSHLWSERQERIERHRARKNWDRLTEAEKLDRIKP